MLQHHGSERKKWKYRYDHATRDSKRLIDRIRDEVWNTNLQSLKFETPH